MDPYWHYNVILDFIGNVFFMFLMAQFLHSVHILHIKLFSYFSSPSEEK